MSDYIYLAAAYGAIWLVIFIFVFSMQRRQSHIETELQTLEDMARRQERKA